MRYLQIDEILAIARTVNGTEHSVRTVWLAMRVFLRFNGVGAGAVPPPVFTAGPFVEDVAQDHIDVPAIAKRLSVWFLIN